MKPLRIAVAFGTLALLAASGSASAVPARLPVQGVLTNPAGTPLDGTFNVTFSLYDTSTGGTPLYTESQAITADVGVFTAYLGTNVPLDLGIFNGTDAWLGITVGTDAEMTPRLQLGTVPYAAHAASTDAVPAGAVMFFDLSACPHGWSAMASAQGRLIAGAPAGGTVGRTVGTALTDGENRAHQHAISATPVTVTSAGSHTHPQPDAVTSATDTHGHAWAILSSGGTWSSFNAAGTAFDVISYGDGLNEGSSADFYPFGPSEPPLATIAYYTTHDSHGHTVSFGTGFIKADGAHAHTATTAAASTAGIAAGLPYLQLLACRKN